MTPMHSTERDVIDIAQYGIQCNKFCKQTIAEGMSIKIIKPCSCKL